MLFHTLSNGTLVAISQPAHALVAADLARAWRDAPEPEVLLGAAHHDIGWAAWEAAPTLDAERGRPFDFRRIATADHVRIWSSASTLALAYGRVPALITSMHGTRLYASHDYDQDTPEEAAAARAFVEREEATQRKLRVSIAADPELATTFTDERLSVVPQLVNAWDRLSLALCHGVRDDVEIADVPLGDALVTLRVTPDAAGNNARITPWPFATDTWKIVVEGRVLDRALRTDDDLQEWLAQAPWQRVTLKALPG